MDLTHSNIFRHVEGFNLALYRSIRLFQVYIVFQVGAQTETKLKEKKQKVEDALNATKVDSIKETLCNDEPEVGSDIVKRALGYPMKLTIKNADCKECWVYDEDVIR
ncbi:RuBisCO large subunit-binding protein subunit beta, chloroplastic [Tanacetum coccineum]|uniref:RuBisCO large subunit-binding protein subunit beta, chloroplastic n=1 Tax=Tanacetum coccineum TaxID=301880 RepID=A0ABQ5BB39_9ASTR